MPRAEFSGETPNHPGDSNPLQPRFGTLQLLAFTKTKITFEREEVFGPSMRFRNIWQGSWWWLELCQVPRYLLWRGLKCLCPIYNVSCIFYKCLYFSYYMAQYFEKTSYICHIIFYPFIHGRTFRLFPFLGYCVNNTIMNTEWISLQYTDVSSTGYILRCGIAGSYGSSVFNILKTHHILSHSGCINLHFHKQYTRVAFPSHPCQLLLFSWW